MSALRWIEVTDFFTEHEPGQAWLQPGCCDLWRDLSLPLPLPDVQVCALRKIADQICNADSGVIAVFTGRDAAGKLMAAEALSYELERSLHRIDTSEISNLSAVEIENYFVRILHDARDENAILMFDNADRLLNSRLGTLESYRGLVILTTDSVLEMPAAHHTVDSPFPADTE
jgi:hypothetical protein